jgi:hypothetical protein
MATHNFNILLSEPVRENSTNAVDVLVPNAGETIIIKQIRIINVDSVKCLANMFFALSASTYGADNAIGGWNMPINVGIPYSERVFMPIKDTHKFGYQSSKANALVISLWGDIITDL